MSDEGNIGRMEERHERKEKSVYGTPATAYAQRHPEPTEKPALVCARRKLEVNGERLKE